MEVKTMMMMTYPSTLHNAKLAPLTSWRIAKELNYKLNHIESLKFMYNSVYVGGIYNQLNAKNVEIIKIKLNFTCQIGLNVEFAAFNDTKAHWKILKIIKISVVCLRGGCIKYVKYAFICLNINLK